MKAIEKYHVMSLTPRQQAVIRMLLFNLYCNFLTRAMQTVLDKQNEENFKNTITTKTNSMIENFSKYDEFTDVFCNRRQATSAKTKFATFTTNAMKNIAMAIKTFDENSKFLDESDCTYVESEIKTVEDLVAESMLYTYSEEEIKREMSE